MNHLATYLSLMAAMVLVTSGDARAQESERFTFVFTSVRLDVALDAVVAQTGIDLVYESSLVEGTRVSCRATEEHVIEVLACVLEGTGVDYIILSSGTYVLQESAQLEAAYGSLAGYVYDLDTGEPLVSANVRFLSSGLGTVTNAAGRFAIGQLLPGEQYLVVSYVGYRDRTASFNVAPSESGHVRVGLASQPVQVEPVIINGLRRALPLDQSLKMDEAGADLAAAGGAIARLAGVTGVRIGDAFADIHVQGGDAGEHEFRLDGATMFVPLRLGGLIGPFSSLALGKIEVRKAGFDASLGSHLSGIIEASHALEASRPGIEVLLDPISVSARARGHWESLDAMVAIRQSVWNVFPPAALQEQLATWSESDYFLFDAPYLSAFQDDLQQFDPAEEDLGEELDVLPIERSDVFDLAFSDIHLAMALKLGPLRTLRLSGYFGDSQLGRDLFFGDDEDEEGLLDEFAELEYFFSRDRYSWKNRVVQMAYEWVVGARTFVSTRAWLSSYGLDHPFGLSRLDTLTFHQEDLLIPVGGLDGESDSNKITELGVSARADLSIGSRHTAAVGVEARSTESRFSVTLPRFAETYDQQRLAFDSNGIWNVGVFASDRIDLGSGFTVNAGLRLTVRSRENTIYAEPRLSIRKNARLQGDRQFSIRLAAGSYRQFVQQLDVGTYQFDAIVPAYRIWLPVPEDQRPPQAYHTTLDALLLGGDAWRLAGEAYLKLVPHTLVVDYQNVVGGIESAADDGSTFVREASGRSLGFGLNATRTWTGARLEARYDFELSERKIPGRFGGRQISVPWSAPHQFRIAGDLQASDRWAFTAKLRVMSGREWGFSRPYYDFLGVFPELSRFGQWDLTRPDQHKTPTVVQLDLGARVTGRAGRSIIQGQLNILNVADRANVASWSLEPNENGDLLREVKRRIQPRMPVWSFRIIF